MAASSSIHVVPTESSPADRSPTDRPLALAADIGGTFTDVVLGDADGRLWSTKVPTTHDDPAAAIVAGVTAVIDRSGESAARVGRVVHGTTLATNVVLERRGAPVAFITTGGFGSMLELGRQARGQDERHDLFWRPSPPPVPRSLTFELSARMGPAGDVVRPLLVEEIDTIIDEIAATDVAAVAICLLHSYADPTHERTVAERCRERLPGRAVVPSIAVLPQLREYDRAVTTVLSAVVAPVMSDYLRRLTARLGEVGIDAPLHVMSSAGDLLAADLAARRAIATIESGPAAGVIAAREIGRRGGRPDVLALDMGGTTAKASIIRGGEIAVTSTFTIGGHTSASGQRGGGGVTIAVPAVDLAEVGAGGGSIAWLDAGSLRVGPRSAGSQPGPACYARGGTQPTVTDADVVLGLLDAGSFASSAAGAGTPTEMRLDVSAAWRALAAAVADPLGVGVEEAALAVHHLANTAMAGALRMVTVQRGIDPRPFALVVTGGAGPLHATGIAELLHIDTVIVPSGAGVGSAIGLLDSELGFERAETMLTPTADADPAAMATAFDRLAAEAAAELGVSLAARAVRVQRSADVRARGQIHEVTLAVPAGALTSASLTDLEQRYADHQRRTFGIAGDGATDITALRSRVVVPAARRVTPADANDASAGLAPAAPAGTRRIWTAAGPVDATLVRRTDMAQGAPVTGAALVAAPDTTVFVAAGWAAAIDRHGHLVMTRSHR